MYLLGKDSVFGILCVVNILGFDQNVLFITMCFTDTHVLEYAFNRI